MREPVTMHGKIHMVVKAGVSLFRRCRMVVLGVGAAVVLSPYTAQACSVCGGAAMGTDPGTGFNTSILFLLSMPFLVLGLIGGWLFYMFRSASGRQQKREEREKDLAWHSHQEMV